ncbi:MAG: hypothetical protein WAO55_14565 [Candidatus Manganitrophaceae bacterium]
MKGHRKRGVIWILFFAFSIVSCESTPSSIPHADWADVTLQAVGVGEIPMGGSTADRIQAIQHAKVDAYSKLESQVMMLETDSKKKVSELAAKDRELEKKIASFVKGAKIVQTDVKENGVEVIVRLFLGENFKATLGLLERKRRPMPKDTRRDTLPRY